MISITIGLAACGSSGVPVPANPDGSPDAGGIASVDASDPGGDQSSTPPTPPSTPLPPPQRVTAPQPADATQRVAVSASLGWQRGSYTDSFDVYLGADFETVDAATRSSPEFRGNVTSVPFSPGALAYNTPFFWRVDAVGPGGVARGFVYSFRTQPVPLLTPIVSTEYEITDHNLGQTVGNSPNPECLPIVRVAGGLFAIYRTASPQALYVRRFDLKTSTMGPAVQVDNITDPAFNGYHSEPSLFRDREGRLHVFNQTASYISGCIGQHGTAPRYRSIPDLFNSATWSSPSCLPTRVINQLGAQYYDIMGVYDDRSGVQHTVGQSYGFNGLDGQGNYGFPRTYFRINPGGVVDGPYSIVECISEHYAKGDIALGREPSGQRSLHVLWNIRRYFTDASGTHQWNYDLYYARSNDGGNTWSPADGSTSVALTQHIMYNDVRFRAYAGEVQQDSERALGIDSQNRPFIVFLKLRAGTGTPYGGHIDVLKAPVPQYDLCWLKWTGVQWVTGVVNATTNWAEERPKVRVDEDDKIFIFLNDQPAYFLSSNAGASWSGWTTIGTRYSNSRIISYPDPIEPIYHYLAYTDRDTNRMYFMKMQLTNPYP